MSIGMDKWRFEVTDSGGVHESWDFLVEKVTGAGRRANRDPDPPWNLNPDYQRGPVWTEEQQSRFIGHVLAGGIQPPIYVQRWEGRSKPPIKAYWTLPEEVIDGQQRIRAITAFMEGKIPALVYHDAEWHPYWLKDMDKRESNFTILYTRVIYIDLSRTDRLRFYLRLNAGGVKHTEEELDRVRALLLQEAGSKEA